MRGYVDYDSISEAAEVLTERWSPLIIRELLLGTTHFNELKRAISGIPRASLSQRLKMLEEKGVVMRWVSVDGRPEYQLTATGRGLESVIRAMGVWANYWLNQGIREDDIDLRALMWEIHRRVDIESLPQGPTVIQFEFTGEYAGRFWLLLERPKPEVRDYDAGIPVDLFITADTMTIAGIWKGRMGVSTAIESGLLNVKGSASLVVQFPNWLTLNS